MTTFFEKITETDYSGLEKKISTYLGCDGSKENEYLNGYKIPRLIEQRYNVTKNKIECSCFAVNYGYVRLWVNDMGVIKKEKEFVEEFYFGKELGYPPCGEVPGPNQFFRLGLCKTIDLKTNKCDGYLIREQNAVNTHDIKIVHYNLDFVKQNEFIVTENFGNLPAIFFERITSENLAQLLVKEVIKLKGYCYNSEGDLCIEYYINNVDVEF